MLESWLIFHLLAALNVAQCTVSQRSARGTGVCGGFCTAARSHLIASRGRCVARLSRRSDAGRHVLGDFAVVLIFLRFFFFTLDCLLLAKPSQLLAECWKDSFHSLLKNFEIDVPAAWPQTEFTSRFQLSYRDHITKNVSKEAGVAVTRALWVALGM